MQKNKGRELDCTDETKPDEVYEPLWITKCCACRMTATGMVCPLVPVNTNQPVEPKPPRPSQSTCKCDPHFLVHCDFCIACYELLAASSKLEAPVDMESIATGVSDMSLAEPKDGPNASNKQDAQLTTVNGPDIAVSADSAQDAEFPGIDLDAEALRALDDAAKWVEELKIANGSKSKMALE